MNKGVSIVAVIAVIVVAIVALFATNYNSLVTALESVEKKESDISVQLERRADLIPNLVNTVKGYTSHESDIIDKVTTARQNLVDAGSLGEKIEANGKLTEALNNLFVIVENYPELASSQNFINLQDELAGTENRIAVSRKEYNSAVENYNSKVKKFPTNLIAGMFNFDEKDYFEAKETSNNVPEVSFE